MATSGLPMVPPITTTEFFVDPVGPENIFTNVDIVDPNWVKRTTSDYQINELGERHGKIMRDIRHLEHRLDQFLSFVEN
jgi:hypothetical protein